MANLKLSYLHFFFFFKKKLFLKLGTKRLLAKPRNLPVLLSDGTKKNMMLCLIECISNKEKRYLATFKPIDSFDDEENSETEESSEGLFLF